MICGGLVEDARSGSVFLNDQVQGPRVSAEKRCVTPASTAPHLTKPVHANVTARIHMRGRARRNAASSDLESSTARSRLKMTDPWRDRLVVRHVAAPFITSDP
jgi:hypothetical protein